MANANSLRDLAFAMAALAMDTILKPEILNFDSHTKANASVPLGNQISASWVAVKDETNEMVCAHPGGQGHRKGDCNQCHCHVVVAFSVRMMP